MLIQGDLGERGYGRILGLYILVGVLLYRVLGDISCGLFVLRGVFVCGVSGCSAYCVFRVFGFPEGVFGFLRCRGRCGILILIQVCWWGVFGGVGVCVYIYLYIFRICV